MSNILLLFFAIPIAIIILSIIFETLINQAENCLQQLIENANAEAAQNLQNQGAQSCGCNRRRFI